MLPGIVRPVSEAEENRERSMITVELVEQVHALRFEQGKTYEEIGVELGLTTKTIAKSRRPSSGPRRSSKGTSARRRSRGLSWALPRED